MTLPEFELALRELVREALKADLEICELAQVLARQCGALASIMAALEKQDHSNVAPRRLNNGH